MNMHHTSATRDIYDDSRIHRVAPSVFASAPIDGVSDRYAFVPTSRVLEAMRAEGWNVVQAAQTAVRLPDNRLFARHMLRFRHPDVNPILGGDSFPEVVLLNSHDRTS